MISVRDRGGSLTSFGAVRAGGVPWQYQEAVELWARQNRGTHARMAWNPVLRCVEIQFELKPDDPRMKGWQEGRLKMKPVESVFLHRWDKAKKAYVAIPLEELGVSGLEALLDKGNLWSGRGEYRGLMEAVKAADEHNQKLERQVEEASIEAARLRARDERRWLQGAPVVSVPTNLENGSE